MVFANHLRSRITPAYAGQILLDEHSVLNIQESSPHTRDKWVSFHWSILSHGIIPAYAGQISSLFFLKASQRDHPRIRGTNNCLMACFLITSGSSPHTRDKSRAGSSLRKAGRIIPAYAGQMKDTTYDKFSVRDHPRIRGTNISKQLCNIAFWGSSPHTRDKFPPYFFSKRLKGIIPAYAGQIARMEDR